MQAAPTPTADSRPRSAGQGGQVTLSQLRTGYCPLVRATAHRIGLVDYPICQACGEEVEDVEHLLAGCSRPLPRGRSLPRTWRQGPALGALSYSGGRALGAGPPHRVLHEAGGTCRTSGRPAPAGRAPVPAARRQRPDARGLAPHPRVAACRLA